MPTYATSADLTTEYPDTVQPANVDTLLMAASDVVDTALVGVVYDTDAVTGLPTDATIADRLTKAVCAIVAEWVALGSALAGSSQQWGSVSIGNVSLSGVQSADTDHPRIDGFPVPPLAISLLRGAGVRVVYPL